MIEDSRHVWSQIGYDKCFFLDRIRSKKRGKKATNQNFEFVRIFSKKFKAFHKKKMKIKFIEIFVWIQRE